eukprot:gene4469-5063_t
MSKTLSIAEQRYPAIEKEALAIIEAVRKWSHFLSRESFILIRDQQSVSFMFDNRKRSKIKHTKIQSWRIELSEFSYTIQYREGKNNVVPDFIRAHCAAVTNSLQEIHARLCHPGVTRLLHSVKANNLPYSMQDVRDVCSHCRICAELKPNFYQSQNNKLIKATRPMERISIDFKGPLPSSSRNKYFLTVIDEYSHFPFVIPCSNISTETVIACLEKLPVAQWECVLPHALHSVRSLLSTSTNATPRDRFFSFPRKSNQELSLPSGMPPGPVLLRKFVHISKHDDLMEEVELTHVNPTYAQIRYNDGRESSVCLTDLAPCPRPPLGKDNAGDETSKELSTESTVTEVDRINSVEIPVTRTTENVARDTAETAQPLRHSTRIRRKPQRYGFEDDG